MIRFYTESCLKRSFNPFKSAELHILTGCIRHCNVAMLKGYKSKSLAYVFCCYFSNWIELKISMKQLLLICIVSLSSLAHGQNEEYSSSINGLLGKEKVLTYWDFDSTQVRSAGYLNNKGWNDIGSKQGRWTFYYKNGNKEWIINSSTLNIDYLYF